MTIITPNVITCANTSEFTATSGVNVLIARPLSITRNSSGSFSFAAALRFSAMRPFCAAPSPRNTIVNLIHRDKGWGFRGKVREKAVRVTACVSKRNYANCDSWNSSQKYLQVNLGIISIMIHGKFQLVRICGNQHPSTNRCLNFPPLTIPATPGFLLSLP